MKIFIVAFALVAISILESCSDASTNPTTKEFPTYKYSFTGKISNPKNIPIPKDAYIAIGWDISKGSPDYIYFFGESYIDTESNSFTIGFNDSLPDIAVNRNADLTGGLGVGLAMMVTSPVKISGKFAGDNDLMSTGLKFYGGLDFAGMIYIGGDSSKVDWRTWAKDFHQGYSFAKGVDKGTTFDEFAPADLKDMQITIDTSMSNYKFPNWTGINPHNSNSK